MIVYCLAYFAARPTCFHKLGTIFFLICNLQTRCVTRSLMLFWMLAWNKTLTAKWPVVSSTISYVYYKHICLLTGTLPRAIVLHHWYSSIILAVSA